MLFDLQCIPTTLNSFISDRLLIPILIQIQPKHTETTDWYYFHSFRLNSSKCMTVRTKDLSPESYLLGNFNRPEIIAKELYSALYPTQNDILVILYGDKALTPT